MPKVEESGAEYYAAKGTLDVDDDDDDDLLNEKYPIGERRCQSALSLFTTPTQSRKQLLIEEKVIDGDTDSDSDDGADILSPVMVSSPHHLFPRSDSMKKSMDEYDFRRIEVEDKIKQGVVKHHHVSSSNMPEDIRTQANLDMYTEEKQLMRSKIKRSPMFCKEILSLWTLVGPDGKITKEHYLEMMNNISKLIVPPPYDEKENHDHALKDWNRDIEYAKKNKLLLSSKKTEKKNENDEKNDNNEECLNYDSFFKSIFELIDLWTETAEEKEYVDMAHRLISGITTLKKNGKLKWKKHITFDRYFSFAGGGNENDIKSEPIKIVRKSVRSSVAFLPTFIIDSNMDEIIAEENSTNYTQQPMSAKKINLIIAQIYRGKQTADLFANSRDKFKPIRFDKFVLRFFMVQFGTRGVARRHLRHFTSSALSHALADDGKEKHPRIFLFCILLGIIIVAPATEFNPRLSAEYFQPALRTVFPNPRVIEELLGDGTGVGVLVMKQCIEKAAIPLSLNYALGGSFAIQHFQKQMNEMSLEVKDNISTAISTTSSMVSTTTKSKKNYMVNFDESMLIALDMWLFSDSLRIVRERAALQTFKRFLDAYVERKGLSFQKRISSDDEVRSSIDSNKSIDDKITKKPNLKKRTSTRLPLKKATKVSSIKESSSSSKDKRNSDPKLKSKAISPIVESPIPISGESPRLNINATQNENHLSNSSHHLTPQSDKNDQQGLGTIINNETPLVDVPVDDGNMTSLLSPDHRNMLKDHKGARNNLLPELNHESNSTTNNNSEDRPSTAPLKSMFRQYSQESFAAADLIRSRQQLPNNNNQPYMPLPSPLGRIQYSNRSPSDLSTSGGTSNLGLAVNHHQHRPYHHQSSYSSLLMSPKTEPSGHLLPLDFAGNVSGGIGEGGKRNSGSSMGSEVHNYSFDNRDGFGNEVNKRSNSNRNILSPPSLHHNSIGNNSTNSLSGVGRRVIVVEDDNLTCDDEVYEFLVKLKLEKYSPIFAKEEIDMDCLLVMTEEDLKDLELSKGARIKILRAIGA